MDAKPLILGNAIGRAAIGIGAIVDPARLLGPWIGPKEARRTSNHVIGRALGGRDLVIAAGTLRSMGDTQALRPWLAAAVLADVVDFGATAAAGDDLPLSGRAFVMAIAGAAAAGGAIALALLEDA